MTTIALTPSAADPASSQSGSRSSRFSTVRGLLFDTLVPWAAYTVATSWFGCSPVQALMLSAVIPLADAVRGLRRGEGASPVGVLVGLGIVCSVAAMLLGGGARVLLLRESSLTALTGLVCLASLPARRPLMFFFMRHFVAGSDREKLRQFDHGLERASFRRVMRIVTAVWGGVFLLEFTIRAWLVFHYSPSMVLGVSPLLMNGMIAGATAWNVWYARRQKDRAVQAALAVA